MTPEQTALADVRAALAEMEAALAPYAFLIPQTAATQIAEIRARLSDAVSNLETAIAARGS